MRFLAYTQGGSGGEAPRSQLREQAGKGVQGGGAEPLPPPMTMRQSISETQIYDAWQSLGNISETMRPGGIEHRTSSIYLVRDWCSRSFVSFRVTSRGTGERGVEKVVVDAGTV